MGKPKTEYRVVCARFGTAGHSSHVWVKKDRAKALQSKTDADHHADMHPKSFYAKEAEYRIQTRTVTEWQDV